MLVNPNVVRVLTTTFEFTTKIYNILLLSFLREAYDFIIGIIIPRFKLRPVQSVLTLSPD